ncbi:MAG: hypothetical protein WCJ40_19565, partial [Planctomycetota bacterium]
KFKGYSRRAGGGRAANIAVFTWDGITEARQASKTAPKERLDPLKLAHRLGVSHSIAILQSSRSYRGGAAGLACDGQFSQVFGNSRACVNRSGRCLHIVCTDKTLNHLILKWLQLPQHVRLAIQALASIS